MKISSRMSEYFDRGIRQRGSEYYWGRLVRIEYGSRREVRAEVIGSQRYQATFRWDEPSLYASCECPYFEGTGACKHLWATLLAADQFGYLSEALAAPKLTWVEVDPYVDLDSIEDFELAAAPPDAAEAPWQAKLTDIARYENAQFLSSSQQWPAKKQVVYEVDVPASRTSGMLVLSLGSRNAKADGTYSNVTPLRITRAQLSSLPVREDRDVLSLLAGASQFYSGYDQLPASPHLSRALAEVVMPAVIRTGRCFLKEGLKAEKFKPLVLDEAGPWHFELEMSRRKKGGWVVNGFFRRGEERMDVRTPALIAGGFVFTNDSAASLAEGSPAHWISHLRKEGGIEAADGDEDRLLGELLRSPQLPSVIVPEELRYQEIAVQPKPFLQIRSPQQNAGVNNRLRAELSFDYGAWRISAVDQSRGLYIAGERKFLLRDKASEQTFSALLAELGFQYQNTYTWGGKPHWELASSKLPRAVRALVEAGWHIEADGKIFRRPGAFRMQVSTGVDWFELHGEAEFGDSTAQLPELLEALRRGDKMVQLGDGTYGMLPEEWLRRIGLLAQTGERENGHVRFRPNQVGLLDALLATQPEVQCDALFAKVREELRSFEGIQPAAQPAGFVGQLRDYQREGVGWMEFLRRFSFGGCLADDMGVGKTAQVLAMLEARRQDGNAGDQALPSLVVVPRSLVFNWKEEAARFTPQLRILDYTGAARNGEDFSAFDVVLSTYGTLRRDVARLKDFAFDYVILDEAHAIKNAETESAKAARLLNARHRLALSGTPVENHLGELFALFEFLNPGMLGSAGGLKAAAGIARNPDEDTCRLLAHALRPFILRRTKEQVARELPSKTEQTIYCEMDSDQRKLYNELRQHYRDSLLKRIEREGLAKSKIQVLEALLRLRQAACHPGLIDNRRTAEGSAKFESLLEQLREVLAEGHKALVFSQFTSLLKILRERLDAGKLNYEYLDGKTRDRQARVERFQDDDNLKLFLISLKAGGLGLNLTAAEYVFLLDPWWNPAVEAQAVDRAHRIGQTRHVFAYRLITRDTVEEKVLELQKTKKDLANAIISQDNSVIRTLRREDLELLLS